MIEKEGETSNKYIQYLIFIYNKYRIHIMNDEQQQQKTMRYLEYIL